MHYINDETGEVKGFEFEGCRLMSADEWSLFRDKNSKPSTEVMEYSWAKSELEWCDSMLRYINRGDNARADNLTKEQIDTYAIQLCDYTTCTDGVYSIRTDDDGNQLERPSRPTSE